MSGLIAHEWIESFGGAEKVLAEMLNALPDVELHVLWSDIGREFSGFRINESWLAASPLRRRKDISLLTMPFVWRQLRPHRVPDWILVSSHAFAHHASVPGHAVPKYVYAHTPARYLWEPAIDRRGAGLPARILGPSLKALDRRRAAEAEAVAANSEFVADRVRRAWRRDASVIYPPVNVEFIASSPRWSDSLNEDELSLLEGLPSEFLLGASRLVAYKELDKVIRVGATLSLPVVIAGSGPDRLRLEELSSALRAEVHFIGSPSDAMLCAVYQRALVYLFPPIEDFGIMPVEALAAGCRTVVSPVGGQTESVRRSALGVVAEDSSIGALSEAVELAGGIDADESPADRRLTELKDFTGEAFRAGIRGLVKESL